MEQKDLDLYSYNKYKKPNINEDDFEEILQTVKNRRRAVEVALDDVIAQRKVVVNCREGTIKIEKQRQNLWDDIDYLEFLKAELREEESELHGYYWHA